MFGKLLFLFIMVPLIEIAILIRMGEAIGFWPTILIQVITGFVGATLARLQGFLVWTGIQRELAAGRVPAEKMVDGPLPKPSTPVVYVTDSFLSKREIHLPDD